MAILTVFTTDSTLETYEEDRSRFETLFSSVRSSGISCEKTKTEMFNYDNSGEVDQTTMMKYQMSTIVII